MWGNFDNIINNVFIRHCRECRPTASVPVRLFSITNIEIFSSPPWSRTQAISVTVCQEEKLWGAMRSYDLQKCKTIKALFHNLKLLTTSRPGFFLAKSEHILKILLAFNLNFHNYSINLNPDHKTLTWYRRLKPPLWLSYYNLLED